MSLTSPQTELSKLIKSLSSNDHVWLIHVMNKDEMEHKNDKRVRHLDHDLIDDDIQLLNSIQHINEVKDITINKYKEFSDEDINEFINSIEKYKESLYTRSHDLSNYKNNQRLLNFALYKLLNEEDDNTYNIEDIQNKYFRFLYIIFVLNNSSRILIKLEHIEKEFSEILTKKSLHFKNYDHVEFYKWVLNYIQEDRQLSKDFHLSQYSPIQDAEFKVTILSVFDEMYMTDLNAYSVLKEKISNAWYQKIYRQKNKGKKHHYFFTDKTFECLKIMAKKNNVNEEKILDQLINEHFIKNYTNQKGEAMYSLDT